MRHTIAEEGGFTLGTLLEALNDLVIDGVDTDTPVHIAWQPNYPLHVRTATVAAAGPDDDARDACVYIGQDDGASVDYLDAEASDALGWG